MATFEAPIKIVFPQDLMTNGLAASNFAVLGLGDIVIPGIFIALLLRFDNSLKRKSKTYFYATFIAYFIGLLATIFVMHVFKHAQPALLYLVPACLGTPLLLAVLKGDHPTLPISSPLDCQSTITARCTNWSPTSQPVRRRISSSAR